MILPRLSKQQIFYRFLGVPFCLALIFCTTGAALAEYPWVDSFDKNGIQCDEFNEGDPLFVNGEGFEPNATYDVWIVPYDPRDHVREYDSLPHLVNSGNFSQSPGMIGTVGTNAQGKIDMANIWIVEGGPYLSHYYEIVIDGPPYGHSQPDAVYNSYDDGLDVIDSYKPGFHIFPEFPSILLLSLGLISISACLGLRRQAISVSRK